MIFLAFFYEGGYFMRIFLFILSILFSICWQDNAYATRYTARSIKSYVERTPRKAEDNIASLVKYLVKPLDQDYDKARAIAFWIAGHIKYDEYLYSNGKTSKLINTYQGQEPRELLKSRVGICGDFAKLFEEMCQKAGVRAKVVHGYAYPGKRERSLNKVRKMGVGHAWNYFIYKNKKIYVDTTFMAKGRTGVSGRVTNWSHNRALKEVKRDNRYKSTMTGFDDYYFDFDYKKEMYDKHYVHQER